MPLRRAGPRDGFRWARDVVRGQDGHDDGSNMMRVPNRRLSVPGNKGLKRKRGCAWPQPLALDAPDRKLFQASQAKMQL